MFIYKQRIFHNKIGKCNYRNVLIVYNNEKYPAYTEKKIYMKWNTCVLIIYAHNDDTNIPSYFHEVNLNCNFSLSIFTISTVKVQKHACSVFVWDIILLERNKRFAV